MFNLFKSDKADRPADVKSIRYELLQFIKQELQKAEGGEGGNIKGLTLYVNAPTSDIPMYEASVYTEEPEVFKDEVQRIADDYAVNLPERWLMEVVFTEEFPPEAIRATKLDAAFFIKTSKNFIKQSATAYIRPLSGETEQKEYQLTSEGEKIHIGRDKKAQGDDGFFRTNHIAFPSESQSDGNKYVSRQHARIEWNNDAGRFMLFADEGGVPPRNKIKIRSEKSEDIIKLTSTHIGHQLQEGDQIILGESAVLEFSYQPAANE
ncbi:FHA domain-containing protein [Mucilaginibacter sp. RB4R14]|uniref:FHA domain-containing protein n=1 Tax=Mucilaginibacter aurantiaciroseus TaxID=2949308 RepID=UPI002090D0C6|nr:FHA domain-containing protein [Mucilaginibacter aurantiaciroseus]MCO5934580.1 FHA domain-containing protein [Mucilaginibacter aurantiaciroseus]